MSSSSLKERPSLEGEEQKQSPEESPSPASKDGGTEKKNTLTVNVEEANENGGTSHPFTPSSLAGTPPHERSDDEVDEKQEARREARRRRKEAHRRKLEKEKPIEEMSMGENLRFLGLPSPRQNDGSTSPKTNQRFTSSKHSTVEPIVSVSQSFGCPCCGNTTSRKAKPVRRLGGKSPLGGSKKQVTYERFYVQLISLINLEKERQAKTETKNPDEDERGSGQSGETKSATNECVVDEHDGIPLVVKRLMPLVTKSQYNKMETEYSTLLSPIEVCSSCAWDANRVSASLVENNSRADQTSRKNRSSATRKAADDDDAVQSIFERLYNDKDKYFEKRSKAHVRNPLQFGRKRDVNAYLLASNSTYAVSTSACVHWIILSPALVFALYMFFIYSYPLLQIQIFLSVLLFSLLLTGT